MTQANLAPAKLNVLNGIKELGGGGGAKRLAPESSASRIEQMLEAWEQLEKLKKAREEVAALQPLVEGDKVAAEDVQPLARKLQQTEKLVEQGKHDSAQTALTDLMTQTQKVKAKVTDTPADPTAAAPGKQSKKRREKQARDNEFAEEFGLKTAGIFQTLDDDTVRQVLTEHQAQWPKEAKVFGSYRSLDDVLLIPDEKQRKQTLLDIGKALSDALARRTRLNDALDNISIQAKSKNQDLSKDLIKAITEAGKMLPTMLRHIPDAWLNESNLQGRVKALCASTPIKQRKLLRDADIDPTTKELSPQKKKEEKELFERVFERGSLKKLDRTQFYFDEPMLSVAPKSVPSPNAQPKEYDDWKKTHTKEEVQVYEDYLELQQVNQKLVERAYLVYDTTDGRPGAKRQAAEKALAHIPPEFWPPAFLETLQAWRKVERELLAERVETSIASAKGQKVLDGGADFKDIYDFVSTSFADLNPFGNTFADLDYTKAPAVTYALQSFVDSASNGFGLGKEVLEQLQRGDYDNLPDEAAELPDKVAKAMESVTKAAEEVAKAAKIGINQAYNAQYVPGVDQTSDFVVRQCPILAAAAAGIDLTLALKEVAAAFQRRGQTVKLLGEAEKQLMAGQTGDSGALVAAIANERAARERKLARKGIEAAAAAVNFAGQTAYATGAALPGYIVHVASRAIDYGGKIVFSNINWNIAHEAKKLIAEARAGNPVARMQLMEDCALYAKSYICILAKEGHPLAKKFIEQSGLTEKDMTQAMSIKILREQLLKDADQKDETQVTDSRARAIAEGTVGGALKAGEAALKAGQKLAEKVKQLAASDLVEVKPIYDPKWESEKPASLEAATLKNVYDNAQARGLAPDAGSYKAVERALQNAGNVQRNADKALLKLEKQLTDSDGEDLVAVFSDEEIAEARAMVKAAGEALLQVRQAAFDFYPINFEGQAHHGMARYLQKLTETANVKANELKQQLVKLDINQVNWKPKGKPDLDSSAWSTDWQKAAKKCGLPEDDKNVTAALQAYEQARDASAAAASDKNASLKQVRKALLTERDALKTLAVAQRQCQDQTVEFPNVCDHLDALLANTLTASRAVDEKLNGQAWDNSPIKDLTDKEKAIDANGKLKPEDKKDQKRKLAQEKFQPDKCREVFAKAQEEGLIAEIRLSDVGMEPYVGMADEEGMAISADRGLFQALDEWEKCKQALDKEQSDKAKVGLRRKELAALNKVRDRVETVAAINEDAHSEVARYLADLRREAMQRGADINTEQANITFTATVSLASKDWDAAYKAARKAGAVTSATTKVGNGPSQLLRKHLKDHQNGVAELVSLSATDYKARLKAARGLKKTGANVTAAVALLQGLPGFDNLQMAKHLTGLVQMVEESLEDKVVVGVLDGSLQGDLKQDRSFDWKIETWLAVKEDAVKAGLHPEKVYLFEDYLLSLAMQHLEEYEREQESLKKERSPEDTPRLKQLRRAVVKDAQQVIDFAKQMSGRTKNPRLQNYFKSAVREGQKRLEQVKK